MVTRTELLQWLLNIDEEFVGVDEGGLTLLTADAYGRTAEAYLTIGGIPEVWDQHNEHPDYPVEDWQFEARNGDTYLGYTEWVDAKLEQQ